MATFSKKRCIKRCQSIADVYERVRCCADCRALEVAARRQRRADRQAARDAARSPSRSSRRWDVLFAGPRANARAASRHRPKDVRARGLTGLADADDDRRAGRIAVQTTHTIAIAGCNIGYANENQTADRNRCIAAANAALAAAIAIVDEVTREDSDAVDPAAAIEEALEEMQRETEEILAAAEVDRAAAERQAERQARQEAEREQKSSQTTLIVGGVIAAVAILGGGYLLLQGEGDEGEETAA